MVNIENIEQKAIMPNEIFFPFRTQEICCLFLVQGSCTFSVKRSQILVSSEPLAMNEYLFKDEFAPSELENVSVQTETVCIIHSLTEKQVDLLQINYEFLKNSFTRIRKNNYLSLQQEAFIILGSSSRNSEKAFNGCYEILIKKFPFQVGRHTGKKFNFPSMKNDFHLHDRKPYQISRVHFRIELKEDGYYFRDLKSKLGSWVNGVQLHKHGDLTAKLKKGKNEIFLGKKSSDINISVFINN
jgi:hypothetical protein